MWIVKLALNRPYTFLVAALLILLLSPVAIFILKMPVDIFPNIDIPVVSIIWQYTGFSPQAMEQHIVSITERALTTTVNDIEHIESQSLYGIAVVKVYFHPSVKIDMAVAQVTAISQTQLKQLPAGTTPPLILQYTASSVPILQLSLASKTLSEQTLNDLSLNFIRPRLTTIQGAAIPYPYGGKQRQVMVDIDIPKLQARGLTPNDVVNALGSQNLILPSGTAKIGTLEYDVALNGMPTIADDLNNLPIKAVNGSIIYIRDVAHVRDGFSPQTNIVRQDGVRSTLISILKNGNVSTLDIVSNVQALLPKLKPGLPADLEVRSLFDQSIFVRNSIKGVITEGVTAACLTALMILLFLGDWKSTLIIAISIPLSVLSSILILDMLGETINIMTLGGLALAVGILVDDATVTIENIERHLSAGEKLHDGILNGASQIAVPAFVSSLCICIVFVPMFLLSGVAKYLFVPLAEAVVFAVMASYVISRTLVPTLAMYLLRGDHDESQGGSQPHGAHPGAPAEHDNEGHEPEPEHEQSGGQEENHPDGHGRHPADKQAQARAQKAPRQMELGQSVQPSLPLVIPEQPKQGQKKQPKTFLGRFQRKFENGFERLRDNYGNLLDRALGARWIFVIIFLAICLGSLALIPFLGEDFFPTVDAGQFKLHFRARTGTRIEETAKLADEIEAAIRKDVPANDINAVLDNLGLPYSGINTSYSNSGVVGSADGDIQVSLNRKHPTADYQRKLRIDLPREFPGTMFMFQPADIVSQILNFGLPAPIDIQIVGSNVGGDLQVANEIVDQLKQVPGAVDVHVQQPYNEPRFNIDMNRSQAEQLGITAQSIADSVLVSLSGSFQTSPTFWLDPKNGVTYNIAVQAPQYNISSLQDLENVPVHGADTTASSQILANVADISRGSEPGAIYHYDIRPVIDVYAGVQDTDLGSVSKQVTRIVAGVHKDVPKGSDISVRGQVLTMNTSFQGLALGLAGAIILVYLLMVVNFQSWSEPFIIIMALPGALAGIVWMLFLTGTTLSVPALMGAIMCIGVATANSILVISFAKERFEELKNARKAVHEAGTTRLRPVIMTALAMIIGMVPMSLGLGEGGEQNAPLGRAVIGGLLVATIATLFFVPVVYSIVRGNSDEKTESEERAEGEGDGTGAPGAEDHPVPTYQTLEQP